MIVFASLTPSKSIPQKSNDDFKEKYSYIRVGTHEPMRIKDILTKKDVFAISQLFKIRVRHINDINFGKEVRNNHSC